MRKPFLKTLIVLTAILFGAGISAGGIRLYSAHQKKVQERERRMASWDALRVVVSRDVQEFNGDVGVVIKDLKTGWTIAWNDGALFPAASVVKVPIMAACYGASADGKIDLSSPLRLKQSCIVSGSGKLKNFPVGWQCTIDELIGMMIKESDNTATNMLIDALGYPYLNASFRNFQLRNTSIVRQMMDFANRSKGVENYTTARDVAYILEQMYRGKFVNKTVSARCIDILKEQKINDRIPALLPTEAIVAHKTGLERGVCHDAGIVYTEQGDFLICVLTRHNNKTARPVKAFIAKLARQIYNYTVST